MERLTCYFGGNVQGVGFRFTARRAAEGYDVTGYVRNLPDGRVQLEAEGRAQDVAAFVTAVEERMHGYIRKTERSARIRPAEFGGFAIQ